jgi:hypothetical protein
MMTKDGRSRARQIKCRECGKIAMVNSHKALFCSPECSKAFNTRRNLRGAVAYDILMGGRYEREKNKGYLTVLSQLASQWRDEDNARRDGRQSWSDATAERL